MVGVVTDADAFASKIQQTRLKGKKGQKGWMADSFSSGLEDSQYIVDGDAFSRGSFWLKELKLKRNANGAQGILFVKRTKDGPKKKKNAGDFTISSKQKKKQQKRRNSTNETDLFQRGVMPK